YSAPTDVQMRTGNDVAFLLSFAEAASFCSTQYATSTTTFSTATQIAKTNFNKLYFPNGQGVYMKDFWWLRSGGTNAGSSKTASSVGTHGQGMISTVYASSSQAAYPYVRPALWVNSGVFNTTGTIIVQYVYADPDDGYLISTDTFTVPTGSYGPYLPKDYSLWFERAVWDKTSAPISGTIGLDQTITIRYLYYQE
ncbi:MAG: DUF6273 domain-containing protein, partial [Actinomycetia bacterium]|nr:DUF6273 domain-containing protein [Actinomycetes bacterium]